MSASFVFGFVLASLYGLVFFVIFGHGWLRLILCWVVSVAGFFLGQWFTNVIGLAIFPIGELNVIEATIVSWLLLGAIRVWRRV